MLKIFLYILLGLSLGAGTTLIALQERFLRERRRLMALGESQRVKAAQALEEANNKWEQRVQQLSADLQRCQAQLTTAIATSPPITTIVEQSVSNELEQLLQTKEGELNLLVAENQALSGLQTKHLAEIDSLRNDISHLQGKIEALRGENDALQEQNSLLQAEIGKLKEQRQEPPTDDFIFMGDQSCRHLLPGAVARAFIKRRHES